MNFPKEYKPWIHGVPQTPTEKKLDEEIAAGLYDEEYYCDPLPFNENSDGTEDDYGEDSYS